MGHSRSKIKFNQIYILLHGFSHKIGAKFISLMVWVQSDVKHFIYNAFLINCHHKKCDFLGSFSQTRKVSVSKGGPLKQQLAPVLLLGISLEMLFYK